jgi:hypothetical protein
MIKKVGARPDLGALHALLVGEPTEFNGARDSLRGRASSDAGETGDLPEPYRAEYHSARLDGRVLFTVYSFATPIAWLERGENDADPEVDCMCDACMRARERLDRPQWVMPPVKYTRTTSAHQSCVREVLAGLSNGVTGVKRNGR